MHVCAHTDEKQEACFDCKRPMTKHKVSTYGGFNYLINSVAPGNLRFITHAALHDVKGVAESFIRASDNKLY